MSPPPDPAPRRLPISGGDLLLLLIFGLGAVRLLGGFLAIGMGLTDPTAPPDGGSLLLLTAVMLLGQTAAILATVHIVVIRRRGVSWADVGLRPPENRWYVQAAVIGAFLVPAVGLVNYLLGQITGEPFTNPQVNAIAPGGFSWLGLMVMIVLAGIIAPIAEEIAFRGIFFPWLRERLGVAAGVILSALVFASLHGVVQLIPSLAVIGAVLAVLYHRCGSLYPVILAHSVFNILMIATLYSALAGTTTPA